jgi:hypothetical protein
LEKKEKEAGQQKLNRPSYYNDWSSFLFFTYLLNISVKSFPSMFLYWNSFLLYQIDLHRNKNFFRLIKTSFYWSNLNYFLTKFYLFTDQICIIYWPNLNILLTVVYKKLTIFQINTDHLSTDHFILILTICLFFYWPFHLFYWPEIIFPKTLNTSIFGEGIIKLSGREKYQFHSMDCSGRVFFVGTRSEESYQTWSSDRLTQINRHCF